MLSIGVLGLNFKTAELNLREAIARGALVLAEKRAIFFPHPTVLLSTCNRTEIYFSALDLAAAHSDLLAFLRKQIEEPFEHRLYSYFGIDCFAHLCRVTAGLDSAIFAETQIQRQVKVAYACSSEWLSLPACLHYAFQKALKVGKLVRGHLKETPTLYSTLWQMAEWKNKQILLVGNSEINRGFASYLVHKGIARFSLCTRNPSSVDMEGVLVYDRSILDHWQQFDLIVCASKAEGYLITGRGGNRHFIFDLSVPRTVDPEVGKTTVLYNIDQLIEQKKGSQNREQCEELVLENVIKLSRLYRLKTRHALENVGMG